jgi:ABC-type multidrug transport system, permease component
MVSSIRKIIAVTQKEYRHIVRDYRSLYLAFILPLLLVLLFGFALSLDVENISTVVVDLDNTFLSRDLILRLDASPYFKVEKRLPTSEAAALALDRGEATLAIIIPPGWTKNINADRPGEIQVLLDGSDPNFGSVAQGYITTFIEEENERRLTDYLKRVGERRALPVEARIRVWFNEEMESKNLIIPGIIGVIIMIVGAMLTCLVIAREFENGTMETIKSLPINAWEFLLGKALPYFAIAFIDILVAVIMGKVLFGVAMKGSFWLFILAAILYIFVAVNLGLLISTATRSQLVANQIAPIVTFLPSVLLSDYIFPQVNMPTVLSFLTYLVPATYFIHCLKGVFMKNIGFYFLWPDLIILAVMATVIGLVNVFLLKKEGL